MTSITPTAEAVCVSREDGTHCEHWWDNSGPCCDCGDDTHDGTEEDHGEPEADAVAAARAEFDELLENGIQVVAEGQNAGVVLASLKQATAALIAAAQGESPRAGCLEPQPDGTPCIIRHMQGSDINHFSDAALAGTLDDLDERVAELEAALRSVEWNGVSWNGGYSSGACPRCGQFRQEGHTDMCIVGRALAPSVEEGGE